MDSLAEHDDIVLVIDRPDDLLMADPSRFLAGSGRLDSGMDELVERFFGQRRVRRRRQRLVLDLTAAEWAPGWPTELSRPSDGTASCGSRASPGSGT